MKHNIIRFILLMGISIGLLWSQTALAVVYVDKDRPAGGNGTSWAQAYNSLATAVSEKRSSVQEFWIAEGTYTPSATITIYNDQNLSFYGGFAGNETARNQRNISGHPVIIDGQGSLQHVFYVLYQVTNVRFDGLTIQGGAALGTPKTSDVAQGSGILVNTVSSLVIANCTFKNNTSRGLGGAVAILDSASVSITDSTFTGNSTLESGGGALSIYWTKTTPQPVAVINRCSFEGNQSDLDGGAIYTGYYPITVKDSTFIGNTSVNSSAGALKLDYNNDSVSKIERCIFMKNTVTSGLNGGALQVYAQSVEVENTVFAYNTTLGSGGAVGLHSGNNSPNYNSSMTTTFTNCTFYENSAAQWGGGIANIDVSVNIYNSIFRGNTAVNKFLGVCQPTNYYAQFDTAALVTRYSDIQSYLPAECFVDPQGTISHSGSFSADPEFVNPHGADGIPGTQDDNFHLMSNSPCVDRADGGYAPTLDMEYNARVDLRQTNQGIGNPNYADLGPYEVLEDDSVIIVPSTYLLLRNAP